MQNALRFYYKFIKNGNRNSFEMKLLKESRAQEAAVTCFNKPFVQVFHETTNDSFLSKNGCAQ